MNGRRPISRLKGSSAYLDAVARESLIASQKSAKAAKLAALAAFAAAAGAIGQLIVAVVR